jgi:hypothetical protein
MRHGSIPCGGMDRFEGKRAVRDLSGARIRGVVPAAIARHALRGRWVGGDADRSSFSHFPLAQNPDTMFVDHCFQRASIGFALAELGPWRATNRSSSLEKAQRSFLMKDDRDAVQVRELGLQYTLPAPAGRKTVSG